jgi:hypothetical protein
MWLGECLNSVFLGFFLRIFRLAYLNFIRR